MLTSEVLSDIGRQSNDVNIHKICFIGPSGAGKSSIINNLMNHTYDTDMKPTTCYEVHQKQFTIENRLQCVSLWDCGGYHEQSYLGVKKVFYREALLAIIVLDSEAEETHEKLDIWVEECMELEVPYFVVVWNKLDCLDGACFDTFPDRVSRSQPNSIQLSSTIKQKSLEEKISGMKAISESHQVRCYFGSCRAVHQNGTSYHDMLVQLIKELTLNGSQRFQSDKFMAPLLKRKQHESFVTKSMIGTDTLHEIKARPESRCRLF